MQPMSGATQALEGACVYRHVQVAGLGDVSPKGDVFF